MAMKEPPHPGSRLKAELGRLGLSTAQGAVALGISRAQLHRVIAGDSAISPELALRLEIVIGGGAEAWASMQAIHDVAQVRRRSASLRRRLAPVDVSRRPDRLETT